MRIGIVAVLALATLPAIAQNSAKVIALDPIDSNEMKELYKEQDHLNKKIEDYRNRIIEKYMLTVDSKKGNTVYVDENHLINGFDMATGCGLMVDTSGQTVFASCPEKFDKADKKKETRYYLYGWESGFQFSEDFKYVVPLPDILHSKGFVIGASPANNAPSISW